MAKFNLNRGKPKGDGGWQSQVLGGATYVKVSEITADAIMQHRVTMHDRFVSEYVEILKGGGELAPVQIVRDENGTLWLWDGFHTLEAAKRVGVEKLRVKITSGTKRDAWEKSLGANAKHGIRRSRADLKKAMDNALSDPKVKFSLLNEDQQYSYNSVAKLCATSHPTVSKRWNEYHLPLILAEIDREVRGNPPAGVSLQMWLDIVAEQLHVPTWLVKKRKIDLEFKTEPSSPVEEPATSEPEQRVKKEDRSEDKPHSRELPAPNTAARQAPPPGHSPTRGYDAHQASSIPASPSQSAESELAGPESTEYRLNPSYVSSPGLQVYPSEHTLVPVTKNNLMEIVTGANKFGINAYHLDHAVSVKLVYELDKGEVKELELNSPHEGVLLLHFPLVQD